MVLDSSSKETSRLRRFTSFWNTLLWLSVFWALFVEVSPESSSCSCSSVRGARRLCRSSIVPCAAMDELSASTGCKGEAGSGWRCDGFSECKATNSTNAAKSRKTSATERRFAAEEKRGHCWRVCRSGTLRRDMALQLAKCCCCRLLLSATLFATLLTSFSSFAFHSDWVLLLLFSGRFSKE